jgi:maleylpyruvate isomerase
MADGTALFLGHLDSLDAADLDDASMLPGWTRRHVTAHVHFNACALIRLVSWAASGVERRMYDSPHQRAAEIEDGSRWEPTVLRARVRESAGRLRAALDALSPDAWRAQVVTAQGRTVPATEIPWMRAREVMIHTIDLGTGVTFDDLPADFTRALLADVVNKRSAAGEGPDLAAWLTGRASQAPELGPWL